MSTVSTAAEKHSMLSHLAAGSMMHLRRSCGAVWSMHACSPGGLSGPRQSTMPPVCYTPGTEMHAGRGPPAAALCGLRGTAPSSPSWAADTCTRGLAALDAAPASRACCQWPRHSPLPSPDRTTITLHVHARMHACTHTSLLDVCLFRLSVRLYWMLLLSSAQLSTAPRECMYAVCLCCGAAVSAYVTHGVFPNMSWMKFKPDHGNGAAESNGFR